LALLLVAGLAPPALARGLVSPPGQRGALAGGQRDLRPPAAGFPATPAGEQARWLFGALAHQPIPLATLRAHFDAAFLAQLPPSRLQADLAHFAGLHLQTVSSTGPDTLVATVQVGTSPEQVLLEVDTHGLISALQVRPLQEAPTSLPATPAGGQARWLFGALDRLPLQQSELSEHFDSAFLTHVPAARLNTALEAVGPLSLDTVTSSAPDALVALVSSVGLGELTMTISVDSHGLIDGLLFRAAPTSWAQIDAAMRSVAPDVAALVASVHGHSCQVIHALNDRAPLPIGSAFKLYVLDALAAAIAKGTVHWDERLTLSAAEKSLPSGQLQEEPAGTRLSVQQVAAKMISISDNTAADMLAGLLGRAALEAATRATGMVESGLDAPFLTTRELFTLKLHDWPKLAERYLAVPAAARTSFLAHDVDPLPLPSPASAASWTTPRDVEQLEWFASPDDLCLALVSLELDARQSGLSPLGPILSANDGGIGLPSSAWRQVWFKGGSEPGVLALAYLATTRAGRTYAAVLLASNPLAPLGAGATATLVGAARDAFELVGG
jgi:hypothetical protein